jgi:elongator complex protein 3
VDFVKGCLDAMNGYRSDSIFDSQLSNETSEHRCIGMTFETRPDQFGIEQCENILILGGTRVELGVQSVYDGILKSCSRGHGSRESIEATRIAKDAGLKVGYHIMPGLPGSGREMDIESARRIFEDPDFRPDMIKIYPTLVVKGTELHEMWVNGEYEPLTTREAALITAEIKRITPPWIRIQRIQRDIPTPIIEAGVDMSNLRQVAGELMRENGWKCRCIRCREIGHRFQKVDMAPSLEEFEFVTMKYDASGGTEYFISLEHEPTDSLMGYIRAREPSPEAGAEELTDAVLVRELKVFGQMVPLGEKKDCAWQHKGAGRHLLSRAEELARDVLSRKKILITSGIGVREYYRSLGYLKKGYYMEKEL